MRTRFLRSYTLKLDLPRASMRSNMKIILTVITTLLASGNVVSGSIPARPTSLSSPSFPFSSSSSELVEDGSILHVEERSVDDGDDVGMLEDEDDVIRRQTMRKEHITRERNDNEEEIKGSNNDEDDIWATLNLSVGGSDSKLQNKTEVVAQVGGKATFTCHTHHLADEMVTWLKRDDDQLLTVGSQVYAAENRFTATHSHQNKAWQLWVKDVQLSDAGHYECQLTTHPPVTFHFILKVTQAEAVVGGPPEVYIEEGSELALECHVRFAASPPVYIFWYHNATMVNYARQHSLEVQHHNYTSNLVVTQVRSSDAGTYTCEPHLATPANVTVHVFRGKTPAAMHHGRNNAEGGGSISRPHPIVTFISVLLLAHTTLMTSHKL